MPFPGGLDWFSIVTGPLNLNPYPMPFFLPQVYDLRFELIGSGRAGLLLEGRTAGTSGRIKGAALIFGCVSANEKTFRKTLALSWWNGWLFHRRWFWFNLQRLEPCLL